MGESRTADGYVRVSRRAGREGDGFISPEVQRQRIQGWADANGVGIVAWWEEIDASGAKRDRPMFQEALASCERGETGGIVVAKLDRFARSAVDALESIKRLNDAGARLVSVEDGFDGSTAMGRFAIGILTLIAELELERIRDSWSTAVTEAVGRGIHISARVPTGYARNEERRLVPVEPAASAIREVFRRRALGVPYSQLARFLEEQEVRPPSTGNAFWIRGSVQAKARSPQAQPPKVNSSPSNSDYATSRNNSTNCGDTSQPNDATSRPGVTPTSPPLGTAPPMSGGDRRPKRLRGEGGRNRLRPNRIRLPISRNIAFD